MSRQSGSQFDKFASNYRELHAANIKASGEGPDYFAAYKAKFVANYFQRRNQTSPKNFLDFGCGVGGTISHLLDQLPGTKIHGVDVSADSIDVAKATHTQATFDQVIGDQLPRSSNAYDGAMAACVYHHIAPEKRQLWTREIFNALSPGGVFFIFEHNPLNPLTVRAVNDCPFDEDAILLKHQETEHLMKSAGFLDVRCDYIVFFPKFLSVLRPLEKLLTPVPFGAQYVVVGKKGNFAAN